MSQKQLRFDEDVGAHEFVKLAKKYRQQQEEECASVGRIVICAMSPPRLADIGVLFVTIPLTNTPPMVGPTWSRAVSH